ncbi:COX15/CtaA family protein [Coraliomargarita parva]|uniref:COX15/CtaA family protein n=1 Tax=Coraliomargarita parva TaxID=3014050 RepID=UPI0022B3D656|nr:COX15/CtaA family protein [Coraliomargarita parva]
MPSPSRRTHLYKPYFFFFCLFALVWITMLLFAGGFTTSIKAGMAFLDWPLSNGSVNPDGWLSESDKMAEHSHRLLGMQIGLISIALVLWTYLRESRTWVRRLARVLLLVVILQGVLGGARVRFDRLNLLTDHNLLAQSFAVLHACGAMIVLGLLVAITLAGSRNWIECKQKPGTDVPDSLRKLGLLTCGLIFIQILLGAIMRHADAGLAIARFPLAREGSLFPAEWNFAIGINFAHRCGAVLVTLILLIYIQRLFSNATTRKALALGLYFIPFLISLQIYLGALTIWTAKNPYAATLHHLVGAFLLASTWALTFLLYRPLLDQTGANYLAPDSRPYSDSVTG